MSVRAARRSLVGMAALSVAACKPAYVSPAAHAALVPLDSRIVDLERLVRGCYRVVEWKDSGTLSFAGPTSFMLDSTVESHDRYYRRLRMTSVASLGGGTAWSVKLPDSLWLEWREPPRGLTYGGVYVDGVRHGDSLLGVAKRYSDVTRHGSDPKATFVAVRSACPRR